MNRILVIDDDPSTCNFLRRGLTLEGFEVKTTTEGSVGLELAEQFAPDLVILDRRMVGMSGPEVLAQLRQTRPGLPVLMLSGSDPDPDDVDKLRVDVYLLKPIEFERLLAAVRALLAG